MWPLLVDLSLLEGRFPRDGYGVSEILVWMVSGCGSLAAAGQTLVSSVEHKSF